MDATENSAPPSTKYAVPDRIREDGEARRETVGFAGKLDPSAPIGTSKSQSVAALTIGAPKTTPDACLHECLPRLRDCAQRGHTVFSCLHTLAVDRRPT